ncbi:MAG TPA: hypothetical protein VNA20_00815 [Frankiaceae bacterium]|nr:hypothetical protein [Frankiaceae bacterium]
MDKRTLSLKREALTELTAADLAVVAGGAPPTLKVAQCVGDLTFDGCEHPTLQYSCLNCISHPPCTI